MLFDGWKISLEISYGGNFLGVFLFENDCIYSIVE